ncbi:MAG: hypothetical protein ACRDJM_05845 [Actinomycetota bacterium]
MRRILLASALAGLTLAACGGGDGTPSAASSSPARARPTSTGTISVVHPQPGAVINGTTMRVRVQVTGARVLVSGKASRDVRPDTGHVHLALDGKTVTLLAGLEYEIKDLTPGQHILQAEFAAADHGPFNPRVLATATFSVR